MEVEDAGLAFTYEMNGTTANHEPLLASDANMRVLYWFRKRQVIFPGFE